MTTQRLFYGLAMICVGLITIIVSQGLYVSNGVAPEWIDLMGLTPFFNIATSHYLELTLIGVSFIIVAIVLFSFGGSTRGGQAD